MGSDVRLWASQLGKGVGVGAAAEPTLNGSRKRGLAWSYRDPAECLLLVFTEAGAVASGAGVDEWGLVRMNAG